MRHDQKVSEEVRSLVVGSANNRVDLLTLGLSYIPWIDTTALLYNLGFRLPVGAYHCCGCIRVSVLEYGGR